jgi:DNA polymerase-1
MKFKPTKPLHIYDIRGYLLKSYWQAKKTIREDSGNLVPSWEAGFSAFLERYLLPALEVSPPRKIVAVTDAGSEYRSAIYPPYKGRRKKASAENREAHPIPTEQIKTLMETAQSFLCYLGVKVVGVPGQEADDVIALLCRSLSDEVKIVHTVDADLLQLVDKRTMVDLGGEWFTTDSEYYGAPLHLIVLAKSLVGDSSDEYPGVDNFGPEKWKDLIRDFGIDGLEQLDEAVRTGNFQVVEKAYKASGSRALGLITKDLRGWSTSYQLATLNPDICYGSRKGAPLLPKWEVRIPDKDKIHQLLMRAKAPDLLERFAPVLPSFTLVTADNYQELQDAVEVAKTSELVAFDFESYDTLNHPDYRKASRTGNYVDVLSQRITGVSFCYGENLQHNYYVSFEHTSTKNLGRDWAKWLLQSLYAGQNAPIAHNANFELSVALTDLGLDLPPVYDTQIMQSYVDENEESNLKDLTLSRFHYRQATYKEVTQGRPMNELTAEEVTKYGCDDSLVTAFHFDLQRIIMEMEGCWDFYEESETQHVKDAVQTFIDGTDISFEYLKALEKDDMALISSRSDRIRKALEENAQVKTQEQRMEHAKHLLELWWELESATLAEKGASQEEIEDKYNRLWQRAWAQSVYVPYTEQVIAQEFIPTKTKINNLFVMLDSPLRVEKVTKSYLSEWLVTNEDLIDEASAEVQGLVRRMAAACHQFPSKKREGPEYEDLKAYAEKLMAENSTDQKVTSDGDELNFGSAPQMVAFLYGKLGLPRRVRSKVTKDSTRDRLGLRGAPATGNKASAAAIVYDLQDDNDWRKQVVLDYMDIVKAQQNVSLYYKPYPLWKSPVDGKIHPQLKNCGTVTRRPSGTAPNVLQVSSKDDAKIRKAYIPPSRKYAYVCLDFNGQELRITASESQDKQMVEAYVGENRKDIHSLTASGFATVILQREGFTQFHGNMEYAEFLHNLKAGEYQKAFNYVRKLAKEVNFLIIYGGGYTTLAQNLLIALELAKDMMNNTFRLYSGLLPWQQRVVEFARSHGYVETAYGNRRHLTRDLYSSDDFLRSRQERQAVNATIQGCAADILKRVLSDMRRRKVVSKYKMKGLKPVYDEIAGCVLLDAIPDYIEEMKEIMEVTPPGHIVPMEIEAAIGLQSWGDKKELGRPSHQEVTDFIHAEQEALGWK